MLRSHTLPIPRLSTSHGATEYLEHQPHYVLWQDGSCSCRVAGLPSRVNGRHETAATLHLSPSGSCVVIEYHERIANRNSRRHSPRRSGRRSLSSGRMDLFLDSVQPVYDDGHDETSPTNLQRHITSTTPSQFMPYVKRLLAFRNRFTRQPYLHARFMDENDLEHAIKTNTKLIHVRWPLYADVTSHTPNAGTVRSLDGHCALFLEPHRQTFKVTFPITISDPERTLTASKYIKQPHKFVYVRITQIYSVRGAPNCWRYPLALAMHQCGDDASVPLDDYPTDSVHYVTSAIPQSIGEVLSDTDFDPLQEHHYRRPIVMWTDEAIYRVIRSTSDPNGKLEVEAVIHSDGALFRGVSDFRFIEFHANEMHANTDCEIFVTEAAPAYVTNHATGAKYHLELLLRHLLDMYRQGLQDLDVDHESTKISSKAHMGSSSTIVSQAFAGLGVFTAYANGRMSAVFEDRTLIETDAERRLAVVTDQHGERLVIRSSGKTTPWGQIQQK
ncbi:hypothetical protein BC832DRAFT_612231 [Gaertneriomyces semiglobifer]|nr:hypothetical protein BC832DRAFT_612231 [Gaertneriomyces semiglobifer]